MAETRLSSSVFALIHDLDTLPKPSRVSAFWRKSYLNEIALKILTVGAVTAKL